MTTQRVVLVLALGTALFVVAPQVARTADCIGCSDSEPAVNLDVSHYLEKSYYGWTWVNFVITPQFRRFDPQPRYIPPTRVHVEFRAPTGIPVAGYNQGPIPGTIQAGAGIWVNQGYLFSNCSVSLAASSYSFQCDFPSYSSFDAPQEFRFTALLAGSPFLDWGTWTVTVDATNQVGEWDEWANTASVNVPLWPDGAFLFEEWTGEPEVTYP